MKQKIEEVISHVEKSEAISSENKPLILEKLHEWRNEDNAISDITVRFENWWLEMEPIFAELGWVQQVDIYTQYTYEKKWMKTSQKDVLRMINEEMPETDAEGTLSYIIKELKKGKVVTLGTCKFSSTS